MLEVGAGTGKLTCRCSLLVCESTALEPSAEMAAVLRRSCPSANVVVTGFEDWDASPGSADLVAAGQSWHWVRSPDRVDLSYRFLRPGGAVALAWNFEQRSPGELDDAINAADQRFTSEGPGGPNESAVQTTADELDRSDLFVDVCVEEVRSSMSRTTADQLGLMQTHSNHRLLPPDRLAALLDAVGTAIDEAGGVLPLDATTYLVTARRSGSR